MNVQDLRKDFPILKKKYEGKSIVYLDSAATSQKPQSVIDAVSDFYSSSNANVSRSSHFLSHEATDLYDKARQKVADFIGAKNSNEVIFTKNSTEGLNMVALGYGRSHLSEGDIVLTTELEHNSNLLPWQLVAKEKGAKLEFLKLTTEGVLQEGWEQQISEKVKFVVLSHASNVLGSILPVREISRVAKKHGAIVVVDGSQAVSHLIVDVVDMGCDFYAFSGHKMLGPLGIGVLWGKKELLNQMTPITFGGGMIKDFEDAAVSYRDVPEKFEAGTPNIAGAVGLGVAIDYLNNIGIQNLRIHDYDLTEYALEKLSEVPGLKILGPKNPQDRVGLITFYFDDIHSHDIGAVLSSEGVAVRSGMQCSMQLYKSLNLNSATRASFHIYNNKADINALLKGLEKALKILTK